MTDCTHCNDTHRMTIGNDGPWPLVDVLDCLADAADHLLNEHNCDMHSHEQVATARDFARQFS
jgi:hypothetical protein